MPPPPPPLSAPSACPPSRPAAFSSPPSFAPTAAEERAVRHCFQDLECAAGRFREARRGAYDAFLCAAPDYPVALSDLPFAAAEQILFAGVHYGPSEQTRAGGLSFARTMLGRLVVRLAEKWAARETAKRREAAGIEARLRYVPGRDFEQGRYEGVLGDGELASMRRDIQAYFRLANAVLSRVWAGQRVFECVYVGRDRAEQKFKDRRIFSWRPLWRGAAAGAGEAEGAGSPFYVARFGAEREAAEFVGGTASAGLLRWVMRRFEDAYGGDRQEALAKIFIVEDRSKEGLVRAARAPVGTRMVVKHTSRSGKMVHFLCPSPCQKPCACGAGEVAE